MGPSGEALIRRAKRRDWAKLRTLVAALFPDDFPGTTLDRRLASDFRDFFVAYDADQGHLLGFYSMTRNRHPAEAWLDYIGVDERARGTGLGRRLLAHFEAEAGRRGFSRGALAVRKENAVGVSLYEGRSYHVEASDGRSWIYAKKLSTGPDVREGPGQLAHVALPLRALDRLLYRLMTWKG